MADDRPDCCFDEWARANAKRARRREIVAPVTGRLVAALSDTGLAGASVLDVGCGTGDLTLATLARGAARATGVDLGTGAIESARTLARDRGYVDRSSFTVADGARDPLPPADVVVLHRVLCCFRDADALLDNTLGAARRVYAFTAPVDRGLAGWSNRVFGAVANAWYRMRDARFKGFRVHHHDLGAAESRIIEAGFSPRHRERSRWVWDLRVYERDLASS